MGRRTLALSCVFLVLVLAACVRATAPGTAAVSGTVRAEGGAYPLHARLVLEIRDLSTSDTETVLAETSEAIEPGWEVAGMHRSVEFRIPYDAARVDQTHTYVLTGRVVDGAEVVAVTQPVRVITHGGATENVALEAGGPAPAGASTTPSAP